MEELVMITIPRDTMTTLLVGISILIVLLIIAHMFLEEEE